MSKSLRRLCTLVAWLAAQTIIRRTKSARVRHELAQVFLATGRMFLVLTDRPINTPHQRRMSRSRREYAAENFCSTSVFNNVHAAVPAIDQIEPSMLVGSDIV
jgi:hypothetical protein